MTTILVGVDASDRSLDAIAFAGQVARATGASVLVASTFPYEDHPSRMANVAYRRALEADALETVERMRAGLSDLGEGRVRTAVVARRAAAHGLHDLAEQERPALVVVGSSHTGAVRRVLPGSTGERLLHGSMCPVAVVPKGYRDGEHEVRSIGVAYDGSPESEAALHGAVEIARATGAGLRVIRVLDELDLGAPAMMGKATYLAARPDVEEELRGELDEAVHRLPEDVAAEAVFVSGDPAHEIAVQSGMLDLLIAGSRRYGPLRAVMVGAVSGRILRDAACPVIVVPRAVEAPLVELFAGGAAAPP